MYTLYTCVIREATLTTGGGTAKTMGGSQNFGCPLWGDHKILGTFYGGDHKINFKVGTKIGIYFNMKHFRGLIMPLFFEYLPNISI